MASLPDFIILGAQKAGTTSLAAWLHGHPQTWIAPEKEVHYFDLQYQRGIDWYGSRFSAAPNSVKCGEATPYYLFHPDCAQRMAESLPTTKFIAILRDPVERAFSGYFHAKRAAMEPLELAAALDAEPARMASDRALLARDPSAYAEHQQWRSYLSRGLYAIQLQRYFAHFPRERIHVMFFEELISSPDAVLNQLSAFLEVASHQTPLLRANAGRDESALISPGIRDRAGEHFREANQELSSLLGRTLPW